MSDKPSPEESIDTKREKSTVDDEPAIIEEIDSKVADENPGLETDTSTSSISSEPSGSPSTDGWTVFDPDCSVCNRIMHGTRADKCPVCNKIMHPYCYQQHYMREHLPRAIPLTINIKGTLLPDGVYGDFKGKYTEQEL